MATAAVPNDYQNNTTADAETVDANFNAVTEFLNNSVIHVDGSKAMTAELPLLDGANAASKTYVDDRIPAVSLSGTTAITGRETFIYPRTPTATTVTKTFGSTFAAAPVVLVSISVGGSNMQINSNYETKVVAKNVTTTQFDIALYMDVNLSDFTQTFYVNWIAVGAVA